MKRKRGPAPREKRNKHKRKEEEEEDIVGNVSEKQDDALEGESDTFEGFSSEEDEQPGQVIAAGETNNAPQNGNAVTPKVRGKKSVPTQEELLDLYYRSSSFQSNLFKLQVDELLSEVRVKYEKMEKVEKILHQLKDILLQLPEKEEQLLHAFESMMKNDHHVRVPFPSPPPPKDALYKFRFHRPESIKLVGSYGLKAIAKHPDGISIDVSEIFHTKDYLDHRYFYKRACYLASLAAGIKAAKLPVSMSFEFLHDDERRPVLVLSSLQDGSENDFTKSRSRIRLLPSISRNLFPPNKLSASQANIRSISMPSPLYNGSILSDSTHLHFLTQLYQSSQACSAYIDAVLLGKVWLRQRGFSGSYSEGGFGSFEWTWFLSYLLRSGGPNNRNVLDVNFSSFQLFRGALNNLVIKDRVVGEVVECIDVESGLNVFYKMSPASFKLLQHEAQRTLAMLSDSRDDIFSAIFLTKVDNPLVRYDLSARVIIPSKDINDHDTPSQSFTLVKKTTTILQQALTTRVALISVTATTSTPSISISSTRTPQPITLTLGLLSDPEQSRRLVDHGPPANDREAAASFRAFWGEKAELRRFKDGSILESVVWNCRTTEERYSIVKRIVRYVIARHLSAGVAGDIVFLTPSLLGMIVPPAQVVNTFVRTEGDAFITLGEAFEAFVRHLKDLKDMPLAISSVIPVSDGLTYTSVYPPYAQNYTHLSAQQPGSYYTPVHESIIQLEGSGKWPDDLRAIQKVKIGLFLHMASQLEASHSVATHVGLENSDVDIANAGYLDVVYEHGYAFRVRIQHDPNHREAQLIERSLKNKALAYVERTKFETALKRYQDTFIRGSAHAQALHALRGKHYFLPHAIRLMKRWISAHMLSPQVSPRAIELLVAYVFVHPHPYASPASAEVGFLRTVKLLATWDWRKDPLVIDLNGSLTTSSYESISKAFTTFRKQDPGIAHSAWSLYTNYDAAGSCWTKDRPGKVIAARITALARSSLEVISKDSGTVKQIFTTPLTDYDFLINLKRGDSEVDTVFKNLRGTTWKDVYVDFDPIKDFLRDLENYFGDAILWFFDEISGSVIAGLWNPHVTASRQWKITLGYSTIPIESSDNKNIISLNKQAVLNEIARLGSGLISSVSVGK